MLDLKKQDSGYKHDSPPPDDDGRFLTRRRVVILVVGTVIALLAGLLLSYIYTSLDYSSGKNDILSGKKASPAAGKQAYDKQTHIFLGIIKSEGYSQRKNGDVYYIERPGSQLIEVRRELVDVRDPGK